MTKEERAAIRARAEAATAGPWQRELGVNVDAGQVTVSGVRVAKTWSSTFAPPRREAAANAEFIAHARIDVPALLDEIEALIRERDDLRATLEGLMPRGDELVEDISL